ncbi:MAG: Gfo/Idh/MocA family oxidoreductase [Acidobacteriota bacterium]|nr:Gfo/Idh/MocA family oxidoreductase [Acidobacteriota bacterium]MDH3786893.1 Gfo/Idh/MocA family oxidoreductase [Acidobacteriota bacterium]
MSEKIPVAVVGVGHLGRHHARLYAASPLADLVAVVDHDADRAAAIASEFGTVALGDPSELVGRAVAVSVAVPTDSHRRVAEPLLSSGIDVLIEKPIAPSLEDAEAINRLAESHGRRVMVGHTERFNPAFQALAGAVDAPRFVEVHRLAAFTARSTDIDVVLDLMIHDLDLLLHLDGTEPESVDAVGVSALTDKVDIANARIRFRSGCVANLTASRISAEPIRRVRVFQARTYLSCDTGQKKVSRHRLVPKPGEAPTIQFDQLPVADEEPLGAELHAFLTCIRDNSAPPVDGRQGQNALELAFRVRDAIASSPFAG